MASIFSPQFRILQPYTPWQPPPGEMAIGATLPKAPTDAPTEDPSKDPTENPSSKPTNSPVAGPKSTNTGNFWSNALSTGEKVGAGALGLGATALGLKKVTGDGTLSSDVGSAIDDAGAGLERAGSYLGSGADIAVNAGKSLFNSDQFANIGTDLGKIGSGALQGMETMAPEAAATEAVGLGPEDPIADIGAGAEEVGGALGGAVKSLFSLAA